MLLAQNCNTTIWCRCFTGPEDVNQRGKSTSAEVPHGLFSVWSSSHSWGERRGRHGSMAPHFLPLQEQCMEEQQHLLCTEEKAVLASMAGTAAGSIFLGEWVEATSTLSGSPSAETLGACSIRLHLFRSAGVSTKSEEGKENVFY